MGIKSGKGQSFHDHIFGFCQTHTAAVEHRDGQRVFFGGLTVTGGNIKFVSFFIPVTEVEFQKSFISGGEIDAEIVPFIDGVHFVLPVCHVNKAVPGHFCEAGGGLVAVDQHGTGVLGSDPDIFQFFPDLDGFIIFSGGDGQCVAFLQSLDTGLDGGILLPGAHKKLCSAQKRNGTHDKQQIKISHHKKILL